MRWTEQVIAAHKRGLGQRTADRRSKLLALWEQARTDRSYEPTAIQARELVAEGNANEIELAFYVLIDLALEDVALQVHLRELAEHKSATVRRNLAFYLASELPEDFKNSLYAALLRDKAASVRIKTIEAVGMHDLKPMLPELHSLRSREQSDKVIRSLDYWIPLLEVGYRVEPDPESGRFYITALTGRGISSRRVEASGPNDPRIRDAVEELRRSP